ncbi:MAG: hypothetical protein AMXMBFR33_53600 [Candidatus Xenobia bacterium]
MPDDLDPALTELSQQAEIPVEHLRELLTRLKAGGEATPDDLALVISALGAQRNLLQTLVALTHRRNSP